MGCEQLHEGFFSDLIDVISGIKEIRKEKKDRKAIAGYTSLAKATSNLICVFPVLLSRNIPIGTAQIVTKACERDDTSMLQILFSALSISQASDGIEYVKSVHRNMKLGSGVDVDEFMRVMNNALMTESSIVDSQAYDLIRADMKNINYTLPDSISERGLNEYSLIKEGYNYLLLEKAPPDKIKLDDYPVIETDPATIGSTLNQAGDNALFYFYSNYLNGIEWKDIFDEENGLFDLFGNRNTNDEFIHFMVNVYNINTTDPDYKNKAIQRFKELYNNISNTPNIDDPSYNKFDKMSDMSLEDKIVFKKFAQTQMVADGLNLPKLIELYLNNEKDELNKLRSNVEKTKAQNYEKISLKNAARLRKLDKKKMKLEREKLDHDKDKFDYQKERDEIQDKKDQARAYQQYYSDLSNRNTKMLVDTDVKKANEMMPTLLNVSFTQMVNQGDKKYETPVAVSMIIGVKAKMVPLDSGDIINRIINKNKDKNFFIKFFRSTTREISFFKDLVFSVDKAKSDALSFSKKSKSSGIWKLLERRSGKSKAARLMGTQNSAMAISTLIITAEEVETIKKIANINVEDPSVMAPIMQAYNLMGFGIVDDTLQTFKIMRDNGENYFETYAYTALEKELADNTKAVANLVAASNRK